MLNLVFKPGLIAKHLEWEFLKRSKLEWTLVRPPWITRGKSMENLSVDEKNLASIQVNVEDLVNFMLEQLNSNEWIRKASLVTSKK